MVLHDRTVTVYHPGEDGTQRRVLEGCFYQYQSVRQESAEGGCEERAFLLLIPGLDPIAPGDRVFDGVGPEDVDWAAFLPVNVPGLSQAAYVTRYDVGPLRHTEAGRK